MSSSAIWVRTARAVASSVTAGDYTNRVDVTTDTDESDETNNFAEDTNTVNESADVSITKDDGVTTAAPAPAMRRWMASQIPWIDPQTTNVQLAPCHMPTRNMVSHRLK